MDSGGYVKNSNRAVIAVWLHASQRSQVGMNMSARGGCEVQSDLNKPKDSIPNISDSRMQLFLR